MSTLWNAVIQLSSKDLSPSRPEYYRTVVESQVRLHCANDSNFLYPQKTIPNVRTFRVAALSNFQPIFREHGTLKREFSPVFESSAHSNKSLTNI